MNQSQIRVIGIIVMLIGLFIALFFGGVEGFTLGPLAAFAYIIGFIIAFIGAYFAFLYGKKRVRDEY